ncbi:hypothetical protein A7A08_00282 [Methyloligella halotolerans]|uniref:Transcription regulator HTH AraC N-terminal domain-containing protein n=1 Tax=Methyloligella halotolerans TaxID=1177755 RepID=A0A1E2S291_9HYPH|nr:hypothetical protein A7A08_00282 [Methyloligella halotolerans]
MEKRRELASLIDRFSEADGVQATAIPRLFLIKSSTPTLPLHTVYEPAVCIIAQGSKRAILGEQVLSYDAEKYLVISVDVPAVGQIMERRRKSRIFAFASIWTVRRWRACCSIRRFLRCGRWRRPLPFRSAR